MKYKKLMMLVILFVSLLAVSTASAADNATDDVASVGKTTSDVVKFTNDEILSVEYNNNSINAIDNKIGNLNANSDGTFTDLANDISNANGQLNLTKNYIFDSTKDSIYKNGITINKKIIINGKGFIINGNNQAHSFNVQQNDVTLRNIRFINCYSSSTSGGAVSWSGSDGSLFDCNFVDCHSSNYGGAVSWSGSDGSLFDCNFVKCQGPSSGGAVYWSGDDGSLFDCNFVDCHSSNYGGAVSWSGKYGNLSKCSFENCYISLSNSLSIGNTKSFSSSSSGGAVYWSGDDGNVINSTFEKCYSSNSIDYSFSTTSYGTISSTSISQAGAIHWGGNNGNVINSSFKNCYSKSYSYCNSYGISTCSNTESYSYSNGGSIIWAGNNGNLINSSFKDCYSSSSSYGLSARRGSSAYSYCRGGNVYWNGDNGNVINSTFKNYYCSSNSYCSDGGSKSSSSVGNAIYWYGDKGGMFNCNFNGSYYNYRGACKSEKSVYPIILIHDSNIYNDDDRIVICDVTPLVNNISVSIYDVTDKITLYKQFTMSSKDLTSSFTVNDLEEGEYQIVLEYAGDSFYSATSANNLFKVGKNSSHEVNITENLIAGDNATITVKLNESATGRVRITLSDYTFINELVNGETNFNIPYVKGGINTYKIKYEGDNNYNPIYITNSFKVLYKSNIKLNLKENIVFDETIPLKYTLTPKTTGNITVFVDNVFKANIAIDDVFELENLNVGNHNITVIYNGNEYYSICRDSISFTVSKANPSIKINSSGLAGNVIFEFVLNEKTTGNITITINNNSYSQSLTEGKTNITIPNLVADNYNSVIKYEGDANYNLLTQNYDFTLKLKKSNININVKDITYGDIADVQFNLTTDATGTISVYLNNSFIKNSSIGEKITLPDLSVDKYLVKFVYSGDSYYESCENTTLFNVLKNKPTIDVINVSSTSENITFGDIIDVSYHITDGVSGTVSVYIDSVLNKTVNVGDSISLKDLNAGHHTIKLIYNGDKNYKSCENSLAFEVLKKNIDISTAVKIINMFYGKTQIMFTTSFDGALNINASNKYHKSFNIQSNINNYLNLSDIGAGDYDVEYFFVPNNQNYNEATQTSTLTIFKSEPNFDIEISDVKYMESANLNIKYLNDITGFANITIFNKEGFEIKYSNVNLSGTTFNRILNNLNAAKYTIILEYGGNNNYHSTTISKTFNVLKIDPIMVVDVFNADYGQNAKITVNCNAEGNITIKIGSVKTYNNLLITDNRVVQDINDINAGTYDIKVTYGGNINYNAKTVNEKLTITKASSTVVASVDDITYLQDTIINVKGSVDGTVSVTIVNQYTKSVNIVANTVTPVAIDNIPAGKYNVTITLKPTNTNYYESTYNIGYTVFKKQTTVDLDTVNSVYGKDVIVNVTASEDGKVILKLGDIIKEKIVFANTLTKINFGILAADSYEISVNFDAGDNYKSSTDEGKIIVALAEAKITDIQVNNNIYGENTVIKVKTNVEGILTVKINNILKIFNIDANKLTSFDLGKYDVNNYNIDLSLNAGANYTQATGNTKVTINPKQTSITVNADNSVYGNKVIVKVTASENGKVTVKVGNIVKSVDVEANKVASVDFGILNVNSYEVSATFDGGKNFNTSSDGDSFKISPKASSVTFINLVNNYIYSNNVVVNVKSDVGGTLTVKIGDKTQTKQITANNIVSFDFGILDVNKYDVIVSLNAGSNYIPSQNTALITISPKSTVVTLNTGDYNADEKVIVNVVASENGKITLKLEDIIKNVDVIANRVTSVDFGVLNIGSYDIVANFTAGNNYIDSGDSAIIKVLAKIDEKDINITVLEIKPNQENNIVIKLPDDASGTVTLTIGNKTYIFNVKNGVANINVPKLGEGNYEYVINYSGDSKYSSFEKSGSIDVAKPDPEIIIPPLDEPSDDGSVSIKLPRDATGTVTLVINGKAYSFPVVNGVANIYMPELNDGNYTYSITYSGDGKYSPFSSGGNLNIINPKITAKNTAVQYSAKGKYSVTVYGIDGKVATDVEVIFKISGKQVAKVKTNAKGVASYVVTKNPGKYKIQATALGKSVTKTLTVKHIVTLKTATFKKSAKKLTLQALLAKVKGKYLKNKRIIFKINGKKVATAKTNSKGVAKINIKNPSVVKKLKVGKKVTYQVTYSKDTVKKTAKLKK